MLLVVAETETTKGPLTVMALVKRFAIRNA